MNEINKYVNSYGRITNIRAIKIHSKIAMAKQTANKIFNIRPESTLCFNSPIELYQFLMEFEKIEKLVICKHHDYPMTWHSIFSGFEMEIVMQPVITSRCSFFFSFFILNQRIYKYSLRMTFWPFEFSFQFHQRFNYKSTTHQNINDFTEKLNNIHITI